MQFYGNTQMITAAPEGSGNRFELLVQNVTDYAIYMLSENGIVASWNAGARRFKGYEAEEIIGEHFSRFYTPEDQAACRPDARKYCREHVGNDMAVLACFQQNRAKLSEPCAAVLRKYGK